MGFPAPVFIRTLEVYLFLLAGKFILKKSTFSPEKYIFGALVFVFLTERASPYVNSRNKSTFCLNIRNLTSFWGSTNFFKQNHHVYGKEEQNASTQS